MKLFRATWRGEQNPLPFLMPANDVHKQVAVLFQRDGFNLGDGQTLGFFPACGAFLDVVLPFAVSHKAGNKPCCSGNTKMFLRIPSLLSVIDLKMRLDRQRAEAETDYHIAKDHSAWLESSMQKWVTEFFVGMGLMLRDRVGARLDLIRKRYAAECFGVPSV